MILLNIRGIIASGKAVRLSIMENMAGGINAAWRDFPG